MLKNRRTNANTPALNLIRRAQVPRGSTTDTVRSGNVIQEKRQWRQRLKLRLKLRPKLKRLVAA
jgi:hypothetical protein